MAIAPKRSRSIVNAVKRAYVEEVVNVDLKERTKRHDKLKKIKEHYEQMLTERHERTCGNSPKRLVQIKATRWRSGSNMHSIISRS